MSIIIQTGQIYSGNTLTSDQVIVSSGGKVGDNIINNSGVLIINDNVIGARTLINSGGVLILNNDGSSYATSIYNGGNLIVNKGTASATRVYSGGNLTVNSGGVVGVAWIFSDGNITINSAGSGSWIRISSGGNLIVNDFGRANGTDIYSGGNLIANNEARIISTAVSFGGNITANSGADVADTIVYSTGNLTVNSGAIVYNTSIYYGGNVTINSGGKLSGTKIYEGGQLTIDSDQVASNTTINFGGQLTVNSGGIANSNTINSGGQLTINSSGAVNGNTINSGGQLTINSGGTAYNNIINNGILDIRLGAIYSGINFGSNGGSLVINSDVNWDEAALKSIGALGSNISYIINSAALFNNFKIQYNGAIIVNSGGFAVNDIINGGTLQLNSGAIIFGTSFTSKGGSLVLDSGFIATNSDFQNLQVNSNVATIIRNGATVSNASLSDLTMAVNSKGTIISTTINSGHLTVNSSGFVKGITVNGGDLTINSGGSANTITVNSGGSLINNNGYVYSTWINSNGRLIINSAGNTFNNKINGGNVIINSRGYAAYTSIYSGGNVDIYLGGNASYTSIYSSGNLTIYSGGWVYSTNVYSGGNLTINSGGSANIISVSSGGSMDINSGVASNTTVYSGGNLTINSGGSANIISVNSGGSLIVNNGGVASTTTINSKGNLTINSGGSANTISINSGGSLIINNSGNASNTTINSNGNLTINSGGVVFNNTLNGGILTINSGGAVFSNIINSGTLDINYGGIYYGNGFGSNGGRLILNSGVDWSKSALEAYNALGSNMHYVANSATSFNNAIIGSQGGLSVHYGGSAFNDIIDGGVLQIGSGAILSNTFFTSNGGKLVFGSGFNGDNFNISNIKINSNVNLIVQSAAIAQNMNLSNIHITVEQGGILLNNNIKFPSGVAYDGMNYIGYVMIKGTASGNIFSCNSNDSSKGSIIVSRGSLQGNTIIGANLGYNNGGSIDNNQLYNTSVTVWGTIGYPYVQIQFANNNTLYDGALIQVTNAATISGNIVNSGGTIQAIGFAYTGNAVNNIINSGGTLEISGGNAINNIINSGGIAIVSNGGFISNQLSDATLSIIHNGNGYINGNNTINGGSMYVIGAATSANQINGAMINIQDNSWFTDNNVTSSIVNIKDTGGSIENNFFYDTQINISSGSSFLGNTLYSGSLLTVSSGAILQSNIISAGASAVLYDGVILSGTLTLNNGGYAVITTSTGGVINLVDPTTPIYLANHNTKIANTVSTGLVISGVGNATTVISGFTGGASDQITLANIQKNSIQNVAYPDADHVIFTLKDGTTTTLNITGIGNYGYALGSDANGNLVYEVCFLTGTMIEIPSGLCAVEDLKAGDFVLVYDPITQTKVFTPITWIGHKKTSVKSYLLNDEAGYPVRIVKDAIAHNVPNKDLLITPEHCLFFDGKFIPARMLVNGYSIYYDTSITSYDYYHIETESHSILTADGTLTESYLDTGNRHIFNQDYKIIELSADKVKSWSSDAIAPLTVEQSIVEPIYNNILQRASDHDYTKQAKPFKITQDPDIYLITDQGEILYKKASSTNKKVRFAIPNTASNVWIISRTSRPCDVIGSFIDDRRYLGVLVGEIILERNGKKHAITTHIETDHLLGWDVKENAPCRWTNGKAFLPLNNKSHSNTPTILTLTILSDHSYILDDIKSNKKQA